VASLLVYHWRNDCCLATSYNIRPIVACAYRGVFIEPLPGNALACQNNIKMDLRDVGCKDGVMELAQVRVQWCSLILGVLNLRLCYQRFS
jgi:hypothetical protein